MEIYKKKKNNKKKKIIKLIAIIILIVLMMVISIRYVNINFFPFNTIKNIIIKTENLLFSPFKNSKVEVNNNELLETKIENLEYEISLLKENLKLQELLSDYDLINATTIYRNPSYWFNEIVIDKGANDGIKDKMAVITSNGLIGMINSVTKSAATIKLISSFDNKNMISVGIEGKNKYIHGLISGFDFENNLIIVSGVTNYDYVYDNSKVITTGINDNFPSGLLVGYVDKITNSKYDISKTLYVKSNQNFGDIRYVSVIKR